VNIVPIQQGSAPFPATFGITQNATNNVIRGNNIGTFAIEVPIACLVGAGNGVIGGWTRTKALTTTGHGVLRQKSRLANPLVNELFTGLISKDHWNTQTPSQSPRINHYILFPTFPAILNALFLSAVNSVLPAPGLPNLQPTHFPRNDLKAIFLKGFPGFNQLSQAATGPLQDLLRLNTSVAITPLGSQNPLGLIGGDVAGYPNGRRPGDDIVDIALRAIMGVVCHLGVGYCVPADAPSGTVQYTDGAPIKDSNFQAVFPYFNTPRGGNVFIPCTSINYPVAYCANA